MGLCIAGTGSLGIVGTDVGAALVAATATKRWATRTFSTPPTDDEPSVTLQGRLSPPDIRRALGQDSQGLFSTTATTTIGDLELDNTDGALDGIGESFQAAHRVIRLRVGGGGEALSTATAATATTWTDGSGNVLSWTYDSDPAHTLNWTLGPPAASSDFSLVFRGTTAFTSHENNSLRVRVQDPSARLRRPIAASVYSGSGGSGGGADLAGRSRPLAFG
ncbi:MAG: hypothetical protein K0R61_4700, partial [Microvirga sp.]|nr:hypothetical protein [Microvirga sp.]